MIFAEKSVNRVLENATAILRESPTLAPSARLESEMLLCSILNQDKSWLYCHPEFELSDNILKQYANLLDRRQKQEPISQILSYKEFYSRKFFVNRNVLTPRPETEGLIELALKHTKDNARIIDLGTGSGAIAITLALEMPAGKNWQITAIDNSEEALQVARINKNTLSANSTITIGLLDYLNEALPGKYDLIIANPPYIPSVELSTLPDEVKSYEPIQALDGGNDGLKFYNRILELLPTTLNTEGVVIFELHHATAEKTRAIFSDEYSSVIYKDYAGLNRYLVVKK